MRIGILSPVDISYFSKEFKDENSKKILNKNSLKQVATAVHTLVEAFLDEGHFVRIFTLSKSDFVLRNEKIEIFGVSNVNSYPLKYLGADFINSKRISFFLNNSFSDLDVLHSHWSYTYAYAAKPYASQIPVFCTVRDWAPYIWKIESLKNKITWSFKLLMNEMVFRSEDVKFISNSPYTAAKIEEKFGIKTPIIPNPIKDSFLRNEFVNPPEKLKLLCVSSSNDKRKNIKSLLIAFQMLLKEYPDAHLVLVGGPFTSSNEALNQWREEKLLNEVTLAGVVKHDRLKSYFDSSRIFVTPSLEETFGNTLLESMARKIPVVAGKNSGAIPYVLQQGKAGFLCDVSNAREIYRTIKRVYLHPDDAEKVINIGFQLLKSNYLGSKIMEKHIELYKKYSQSK